MSLPLMVEGLIVRSKNGRELLSVPLLEIAPGEAVVVKGPTGAGKSTLLYALSGLLGGIEGSVRWGTRNIYEMSKAKRAEFRRGSIGFVFQDPLLLEELDAFGNAALPSVFAPRGDRSNIRMLAADALDRLGLTGQFSQKVAQQSGGERQRVAVARALANNAPVLLADEPTASLDRGAADALIDDLMRLTHDDGRTLIAVSHDARFQDAAPRLLELRDGRFVESGGNA